MSEGCGPFEEMLAAYALQALDPGEHGRVQEHLRGCAACRRALTDYEAVTQGMLHVPRPARPPARVRARLIARLAAPSEQGSLRRWTGLTRWAVGAALAMILLLNTALVWQVSRLQAQQRRLAAQQETDRTALALVSYPGTQVVLLQGEGVGGTVLYEPEGSIAVLHVWGLTQVAGGQVYQAWLIDAGGDRQSAGTFSPAEGLPFTSVVLHSPAAIGTFTGLGVTLEPEGGSPSPTGPRILGAEF
ncbi:MAG: hypothetical protein A2Y93_10570 [Chloroflexi bacterium RBG_13_68_17]|nr:MAG: hypothetical protein A2Y93_10570 [Chloroflexi bacterium RBG_13_68_17]